MAVGSIRSRVTLSIHSSFAVGRRSSGLTALLDGSRRITTLARLEPELLVRGREEMTGNQAQRGLRDARPVRMQDGDLPDWREHDALVHELLDAVQRGLAALTVAFGGLFLDEPLDVGVAPVRVEATGGDERIEPGRRVAVRPARAIDERAQRLLPDLRAVRRPPG